MVIYAISIGPLALVLTLQSAQVFFSLFLGYLLTFLMPEFFKEEINRHGVIKNIICSIVMFGGVYLIQTK
jgi:hypothetical protein